MQDGKYMVLCVDDDQDVRESLKLMIEAEGYGCETAESGEEGLTKYRECSPDFILVDLMMEEVDSGTALVTELKALGATAPIYLLSSVGDDLHNSIDASGLGFAGVLQKPVSPGLLISTLKSKLQ